jgi:AraC-like DNA-binding protein
VSNRHLIRTFRDVVGLPPKSFARIRRFHAALRALPAATARAQLAFDLGYADQAHFNHEFRRLSGVTPSQYLRYRGPDNESLVLD